MLDPMKKHVWTVMRLGAAIMLLAATGCGDLLDGGHPGFFDGEDGELFFAADNVPDGVPLLLVEGSKLELAASECGGCGAPTISTAVSSDPGVFEVIDIDEDDLTIQTLAQGQAALEVKARDTQGNVFEDSLPISVRPLIDHTLHHSCSAGTTAYYTPQSHYVLPVEMYGPDGQNLGGRGVSFVDVDGDGVAVDYSTTTALALKTGDIGARSTLTSTVSDTELHIRVADFSQVDGLAARRESVYTPQPSGSGDGPSWGTNSVYGVTIHPMVGDTPLCARQLFPVDVEVHTPDICTVRDLDGSIAQHTSGRSDRNYLTVDTHAPGRCRLDVSIPRDNQPSVSGTVAYTVRGRRDR